VLVAEHRGELHVLLVQRASREGDRWSGHIACPGGVRQREDASLVETARRETREEIGVRLHDSELLGEADEARALVHGGRRPMRVAPFVFASDPSLSSLSFSDEVVDAFWFPFERADAFRVTHWHRGRVPIPFPAWRYEGHTIWGITYGILASLAKRMS
jgi:8-oxo-dGTP pyrophosphatase MutT (NUDIX family)